MLSKPDMSKGQPEIQLAHFPPILMVNKEHRQTEIRFRLVKRRSPSGAIKVYLDIREYVLDEKKAMYTRRGIAFTEDAIKAVINNIIAAQRTMETLYGTHARDREQDLGNYPSERELA